MLLPTPRSHDQKKRRRQSGGSGPLEALRRHFETRRSGSGFLFSPAGLSGGVLHTSGRSSSWKESRTLVKQACDCQPPEQNSSVQEEELHPGRTSSAPAHQGSSPGGRGCPGRTPSLRAGGRPAGGAPLADCWTSQAPWGILPWLEGCRFSGSLQAEETSQRHGLSPAHSGPESTPLRSRCPSAPVGSGSQQNPLSCV